jgi:hypothetical protein
MVRRFVLNTGAEIPSVGLGTWQSKPDVVGNSVYAAVKVRAASTRPHLYLITSTDLVGLSFPAGCRLPF